MRSVFAVVVHDVVCDSHSSFRKVSITIGWDPLCLQVSKKSVPPGYYPNNYPDGSCFALTDIAREVSEATVLPAPSESKPLNTYEVVK